MQTVGEQLLGERWSSSEQDSKSHVIPGMTCVYCVCVCIVVIVGVRKEEE